MIKKNQLLTISMILLTASPAMVMEKIEEEFSLNLTSAIPTQIYLHENKNNSNDLQNQPNVSIEKKMVLSEENVFQPLPLNRRRKSSGSPRIKVYTAPRSASPKQTSAFLENSKKANEGIGSESISISPDEKKESIGDLPKTNVERKQKPVQLNCRRYSLVGPIEFLTVPDKNSSPIEQKNSSEPEEVILPLEKKDQL